jgi:hypothetical protein
MDYNRRRAHINRIHNRLADGSPLIKRNDNAARAKMYLSNRNGSFPISQEQMEAICPGGMDLARKLGNRVLDARDLVGKRYISDRERDSCDLAFDWLRSRVVSWPTKTSAGLLQTSIFDTRVENLRNSYRNRDSRSFQEDLDDLMDFFESLTLLFGPGQQIGRAVYDEVIEMGLQAAPLVAIDTAAMYQLTFHMWTMMNYNTKIIVRMVNAISLYEQMELEDLAKDKIKAGENVSFAVKIVTAMHQCSENDVLLSIALGLI